MSNGEANCILQVCCPPGAEAARAALTRELVTATGCDEGAMRKAADHMIDEYDLAPKDSLVQLKADIAELARQT